MKDHTTTIAMMRKKIDAFTKDRNWQKFHTPKNLSMALATEAAELMELFLWHDSLESHKVMDAQDKNIREEIADIVIYALCFCSATGIDLSEAIEQKIQINEQKYPIKKCRNQATKYNSL